MILFLCSVLRVRLQNKTMNQGGRMGTYQKEEKCMSSNRIIINNQIKQDMPGK